MKTIEEKAKAYDEALKRAREYKKHGYMMINAALDNIFPEIESEDKRIRKAIIAIISNYVDNSNTFKPKMLDWLEKQSE